MVRMMTIMMMMMVIFGPRPEERVGEMRTRCRVVESHNNHQERIRVNKMKRSTGAIYSRRH